MLLLILSLFVLTACKEDNAETDESLLPNNDDYQDIEVTKITYEMFYFQNFSKIKYIIDFETNEVKVVMIPYEENNETIFETIAIFTDEQEKEFINTCYKNGLFTLEEFDNEEIIPIHMHGWGLVIEFSNGTSKSAFGGRARPTEVFSKCFKAYLKLCGKDYLLNPSE